MKNFVADGATVDYRNPGPELVYSGSVVLMGDMVGIAATDIAPGKVGALHMTGVYKLPKKAEALALGDSLYWDVATKQLTKTDTGATFMGRCWADAAANAATAPVKLGVM